MAVKKGIFTSLVEAVESATSVENINLGKEVNQRIKDCSNSLALFAKTYFPEVFTSEFCEFHNEIMSALEDMILRKHNRKNYYVRAAPRGHGKSQVISFLAPLFCICYKHKKNILLVSDTLDQAKSFISAIKIELEENDALRRDFGDLVSDEKWSQDKIITKNHVQLYGRGAGQKLRGNKYGSYRPDLVIIDDLENDEAVETAQQRNKLYNWFMKALLPVGSPKTDYVFIGTVLHYESLLQKLLFDPQNAMWNRKKYQAVDKFSDSPLWDDWESIMTDETNNNAAEDAYKFYQEHRDEMLSGIKVLWADQSPDYYYDMMVLRLQDDASFNSEYQNEPIDPNSAEFMEEWFDYYYDLPEIVEVYGACDPSLGKAKSDRAAIIWAGKDSNGFLYIMDVIMGRFTPDRLCDLIINGAMTYSAKLASVTIETVQFQAMFKDEVAKRGLNAGIQIPIVEYNSKVEKQLRLRGLIPKIKNKYVKFRKDQVTLLNEFRRFPKGSDDGMDAVNMICDTAFPSNGNRLVFGKLENPSKRIRTNAWNWGRFR